MTSNVVILVAGKPAATASAFAAIAPKQIVNVIGVIIQLEIPNEYSSTGKKQTNTNPGNV